MVAEEQPKTVRVRFARLHLGENKMDVVIEDLVSGGNRMIVHRWYTKQPRNEPEDHWYEMTVGEARFQRDQTGAKSGGRLMPWDIE